jgi:hypothetical protein
MTTRRPSEAHAGPAARSTTVTASGNLIIAARRDLIRHPVVVLVR